MVGFRKAMDYFPSVFSQKELYWLDNLMPASTKKGKGSKESDNNKKDNSGTDGVSWTPGHSVPHGNYLCIFQEKEALKNGTEDC